MEELKNLAEEYFKNNEIKKSVEKVVKDIGPKIKTIIHSLGVTEKEVDGLKISLRKSQRKSMNEERLLEICKKLNQPNLIKTKEYVDEEVLETLIYNNIISASDIESAMDVVETEALYVTKK